MTAPDPVRAEPCDMCGSSSVVVVNGFGFCLDHIDEGFRRTFRLVAVLRGVSADEVERVASNALRDLLDQHETKGD